MDYVTLIAQVGFPIASWILIYVDMRKLIQKNNELLIEILNQKKK